PLPDEPGHAPPTRRGMREIEGGGRAPLDRGRDQRQEPQERALAHAVATVEQRQRPQLEAGALIEAPIAFDGNRARHAHRGDAIAFLMGLLEPRAQHAVRCTPLWNPAPPCAAAPTALP